MINENILTIENGYDDLQQIKHPEGLKAVKMRRTMGELDQMKDA